MFTGIIEEQGTIATLGEAGGVIRLEIRARCVLEDLAIGGSVAVNGVCLSATSIGATSFTTDVVPETIRRTSLHRLRPGARVNLERSLALGSRLEGHWVQGHVDAVTRVLGRRPEEGGGSIRFEFELPSPLAPYLVEKGSVALDGISLTVGEVRASSFAVYLIPHTLEVTSLGERQSGHLVNLEVDILAKYVERLLTSGRVRAGATPGARAPAKRASSGARGVDRSGGISAFLLDEE